MKTAITFLMPFISLLLFPCLLICDPLGAQQESDSSVYFVQSLRELELTGDTDSPFKRNDEYGNIEFWTNATWASVVLDQPGDAYLHIGDAGFNRFSVRGRGIVQIPAEDTPQEYQIAIRLDQAADVTGTLYFPNEWNGPMVAYQFSIKADQFAAERNDFLKVKLSHYLRLWNSQLAGAAWFRYQANQISAEMGQVDLVSDNDSGQNADWQTASEMDRSLSLISGGMALSENLQLDRMLTIGAGDDRETFDVNEIEGITVAEFDWEPLVKDIDPDLDTMARYIPADQHAVFIPNFQSLVTLIEKGFQTAGPVIPLMSETSESSNTLERYQNQLGLHLGEIQKVFGPKLISSIAITGGDPYFRTGTDVAVLFEAPEPATLENAIQTTIGMAVSGKPGVEKVSGTAGTVSYSGFHSPDRRVCSYVASLDNVVLVTNSLVQLNQIAEVLNQPETALVNLDEYRFFRNRYMLGDERETALIVITDQTIRRWCGAKWRIATSRRTRAAAVMTDLHARYMQQLVDGLENPVNVDIGPSVLALNQFTVVGHSAQSPTYGSLEFQTPVIELDIQKVTEREKSAYENWRRGYQSNWSRAFDPIAVRLTIIDEKLAADLTVMPLIENGEYRTMSDISLGAKLDSSRNASHPEALTWIALALNTDSPTLKQFGNMGSSFAQVNFMDWLGDAAIVFVDDDPFWAEMEKVIGEGLEQEQVFQANLSRLPVAVQFNVRSSIRLTAFLVGLRGFIDQAAPDMTTWETLRHRETAYVKIGPSVSSRRNIPDDIDANVALYYFASGDTLIFSLSEAVIKRAIDRRLDSQPDDATDGPVKTAAAADSLPLLGEHFAVHVKRSIAMGLLSMFNEDYQHQMQRRAWSALPILNEWRRMYPDRDARDIDRLVWKRELVCPGGGEYRWNEEYRTVESSVYGHPAAPQFGPHVGQLLGDWETGNFGMSFENSGLRAIFEITGPDRHD